MSESKNPFSIYLGIFFISISTLVFEISLTRIFSITLWHHLAYMIISIALFGFGLSGTVLTIFPKLLEKETARSLTYLGSFYTWTVFLSFFLTNEIPFDPFQILWSHKQFFYLLLYYTLLAVPFFFSGLIVGIALSKITKTVGKVYGASMIGSATGALIVIFLFTKLSGTDVIVSAVLIGAFGTIVMSLNNFKLLTRTVIGFVILLGIISFSHLDLNISPYKSLNKALQYPDSKIVLTRWNPISRVDVVESRGVRYAPGLSLAYRKNLPEQVGITIDANNMNAITENKDIEFLNYLPISMVYVINKNPKVLVLGSGGGLEVLNAIRNNATVDVVEKNSLLTDMIRENYGHFSGDIYKNPKVKVFNKDERSYVRETDRKYDVITILTTENILSSTTGIYSQSENYLYTKEAINDYFEHLTDSGVLSITRWLHHPPRESIRTFVLVYEALRDTGIERPEDHILMFRTVTTSTLLMKKRPFLRHELEKIKFFMDDKKFDLIWAPGMKYEDSNRYNQFPEPIYHETIKTIIASGEKYYEDYLFDISPSTDEKPYFFNFFKWRKIGPLYESMGKKWEPFFEGGFIVFAVFVQALILSLTFIFMPLLTIQKIRTKSKLRSRLLTYFLLIGMGFMFVEIVLMQKFTLFLGHPIYAISMVLVSLLFFSGLGSLFSEKLKVKTLAPILVLLGLTIILYQFFLPKIFVLALGKGHFIKEIISIIVLAPLGFLMGMPFPLGIRLTEKIEPRLIPWGWGVNGCASVLGSILPVIIAINFGFKVVLIGASIFYILGFIFVSSGLRRS